LVPGHDALGALTLESPLGDGGVEDGIWVVKVAQRLKVDRSEAPLDLRSQGLGWGGSHDDPSS
jgi:hypothetical protein